VADEGTPKAKPPSGKGLVALLREGASKTVIGLGRIGEGVEHGLEGVGHGLSDVGRGAGAALAAPEAADLGPLLPATDLPAITSEGALGALATRLDREADLFRSVALRELARVGWLERVTQLTMIAAAVCEVIIAACAAAVAIFGGPLEGRAGLFFLAATFVAMGAGGVVYAAARIRASHNDRADAALSRARSIEDRIFRVGLVMEWRSEGDTLYQDALARLERFTEDSGAGIQDS
jgi:hypothetical protein